MSWDITAGATSYAIQRSLDGVTFSLLTSPVVNNYLDTSVTIGTQYYYQVASTNTSGTSPYTTAQSVVPSGTSELSLGQLRLMAQQRADRVNSNFVTVPEWNTYINQSMFELYDILVTAYEDYYIATPVQFTTDGSTYIYPLPNGTNYSAAPAFYKLVGVDLGLNTGPNAWVTVNKFNFIDRNKYFYPNTASTIYGVFNMQYRPIGSNIEFIPTPSANQPIRLWYVPRLLQLLKDTDITSAGISGWLEYVIVDAAIKALQKEESDVSVLMAQKVALKDRIEAAAQNRDAGMPDTISDVRGTNYWGGGRGFSGPIGGW